jgi:hypothetical protein
MGLDWNPMSRAKPGHEAEFATLLATDLDALSPETRSELREHFDAISEPPYATLGAPRVGHDAAADAWLVERLRESGRESELARAKAEMHGYYVLQLLPQCAGLPVYSSRGYEGVDRYTFRGAFLDDVKEILGEALFLRAWDKMTAEELAAYGVALLAHARRYATEHGLAHLEQRFEAPEESDEDEPASKAHILFSAAAWCLWWSERGHGLAPYY